MNGCDLVGSHLFVLMFALGSFLKKIFFVSAPNRDSLVSFKGQ